MSLRRRRLIVGVYSGAVALLLGVYGALKLAGQNDTLLTNGAYYAVLFGAALVPLARGLARREERGVWLALGAGLMVRAVGDLTWTILYRNAAHPPITPFTDGLELLFYPFAFVAVVLLGRARLRVTSSTVWLDGVAAGLAVGAFTALLIFKEVVHLTGGSRLLVATNLAYPMGDLLLGATAAAFVAMRGFRMGRTWLLLIAGMLTYTVTDSIYLYQSALNTYTSGLLDIGWPLAVCLLGGAAWQPWRARSVVGEQRHSIALPVTFGLLSLGVLTYDHFDRVDGAALWMAALSLAVMLGRFVLTFRISQRLLVERGRQALSDSTTGLGNRRALMLDLQRVLDAPREGAQVLLAFFDLDGFKTYNDTFGHPAGDLLLIRLSHALEQAVADFALGAYRMGGDEFCVLARIGPDVRAEPLVARAAAALAEHGDGFTITASGGQALLSAEQSDISAAMREADERMYANKHSQRTSALRQAHDVLRAVQEARDPKLTDHLDGVARLAVRVAGHMGLDQDAVRQVRHVAELHDIGKLAIPDAILQKRGKLDRVEWEFVRRHTVIGERIAMAAPALAPVAKLIRATHERWDGRGYPDGLAGEVIPLAAQIVFVCDAFDAITSERPYRKALTIEVALAELRAGAATQFSPRVVDAFLASWEHPVADEKARVVSLVAA